MTKRERFLRAMRNEKVDTLVWAPNLDYWLGVNGPEGTLPEKYVGMTRNEIVSSLGGCIWSRAGGLREVRDPSVQQVVRHDGDDLVIEYHTPVGSIRQVSSLPEGRHRARFLGEHFIKDLGSLRTMKYVAEATHFEPDYAPTLQALEETGDDGIVLTQVYCVPFIQFAKMDAGYINGYYLWMDHREEVDSLIEVYFTKFLEAFRVLAEGPADVIATGDNMDGTMISPQIFRDYAIPFYRELKKITESRGKILETHWCGRTSNLISMAPECGIDVVEAVVTEPMDSISLEDALAALDGRVVLQGGIPAVLVCEEGASRQQFEDYIRGVILPLKGRSGFILGMSDNVPPNADFARIETVAGMIS